MTRTKRPIPITDPIKAATLARATQYYETRDPRLMNHLVNDHMRMVANIARSYGGYRLDYDDLTSEGAAGLIRAIQAFDPAKAGDASFASYAARWIRSAMKTYIMRNQNIVSITPTADTKRAFFRVRFERNKLAAANGGSLPHDYQQTLAKNLDVTIATVKHVEARLVSDVPIDRPIVIDSETVTLADTLSSADTVTTAVATPEELVSHLQDRAYLRSLLAVLSERERHIITEHLLSYDPQTISHIAHKLGITPQRAHQIQVRALEKMKAASAAKVSASSRTAQENTDA